MKLEDETLLSYYRELEQINYNPDVVLVKHIETNKVYVRKTMSSSSEPVYRRLREIHAVGVPEIYHVINNGDSTIVIEEFINGTTLAEKLDSNGPLSEEEAVKILRELCDILKNFHEAAPPIIHRDIKPSNILITSDSHVTLIDFDASKTYDKTKSRDTVLMGTADFAAPEQYGFGQSDARTDIYALGVLLNVMLTGCLPAEKMYSGYCTSVIKKCISMDPSSRYKNTSDLRRHLRSGSISFLPPGFRSRRPWKMILASLSYAFIIFACSSMIVDGNPPAWWIAANKICAFLCFMAIIAFAFDYAGISSRLPISRSNNIFTACFGRLLWICISILIILTILVFLAPTV